MKKNLSTRIKRNLSRIKSLCIFITDVYLSLDSEFIENYIESKSIIIMSDNRTIELHDNATYIENYGDGPKKKEEKAKAEEKFRPLPESLANPQGLMVLSSLAIHGFLDEHFQPKGLSVAKLQFLRPRFLPNSAYRMYGWCLAPFGILTRRIFALPIIKGWISNRCLDLSEKLQNR